MKYKTLGITKEKVSILGMGCMRLPTRDNTPMSPNIDEIHTSKMIEYAIENGVNYFDTAYPYHSGNSEIIIGNILKNYQRNSFFLATKSPVWLINSKGDFSKFLYEQLNKLKTDYIDFYLLHSLDNNRWNNRILKHDVLKELEDAKQKGLIKHLGFSFHDSFNTFKHIIDSYDKWEFCQIQYNYMDIENQATYKGVEYAFKNNLGIIIMEPLRGGRLANPPENAKSLIENYKLKLSPVEWSMKWLWSHKEISIVLSGVSNLEQLKNHIDFINNTSDFSFSKDDSSFIEELRKSFLNRIKIDCSKCNYCLPCPNGINIPRNFELYNDVFIYENPIPPRITYQRFMLDTEKASNCIECKECESKCPQKLEICDLLKIVDKELNNKI